MRWNKKGNFDTLSAAALGLLVFIIVAAVGGMVLDKFAGQTTSNSIAYNITQTGLSATSDLVGWAPIIVVVVAGILILGYFGLRGFRK